MVFKFCPLPHVVFLLVLKSIKDDKRVDHDDDRHHHNHHLPYFFLCLKFQNSIPNKTRFMVFIKLLSQFIDLSVHDSIPKCRTPQKTYLFHQDLYMYFGQVPFSLYKNSCCWLLENKVGHKMRVRFLQMTHPL